MPLVFDDRNLLPEGVHDATLEEVVSAFGRTSRREKLCDGLRQYIAGVKLTGWECEVLIDGIFVMPNVNEPNDIDLILVLPADYPVRMVRTVRPPGRRPQRPREGHDMIRTDAQLALTRERLQQAERILELTKRDFGHNPVQYDIFSAGIIDIIDSMRADIDAYLGVAPTHDPAPRPTDQEVSAQG